MLNVWVVVVLHLLTILGLAVSAYYCYRLEIKITRLLSRFDTKKEAIPIDPETVFFHLRETT